MTEYDLKIPKRRFKEFESAGSWEQRKLEELATMKARIGWQGLTQKEFLDDGDYYLITGTDFENGVINFSNCHYIGEERYKQDVNIQIRNEDVLITKDGTIGKVAYIERLDKPATLNAGVFVLRGKNKNISNLFLYHYLAAPFLLNYADKQATGGTIKHLNQNVLVDFPIPFPILKEQKKIGQFLTQLDNLITFQQSKVEKTKALKSAYLSEMFPAEGGRMPKRRFPGFTDTWEQFKLGELGSVAMNKRIFKEQTSENGEIPFYKIGTFGGNPNAFISRELFDEYKVNYPYPEVGDILISASGSIGRTVEYTGEDAYFQDSNIVWLKHDERIDNSFLKQFYLIVKWKGLEGSTIKRLYNKNILDTPINLPSIEEQKRIGKFFNELDNLITLHQSKLEKLQNLKQAYLNEIFI